jgi:hypothetical protein
MADWAIKTPGILLIVAGSMITAGGLGAWGAQCDKDSENHREVCEKLRAELIRHGVAVYGDQIPPDVLHRWEAMCR